MTEGHYTADVVSVKMGVAGMIQRLWPHFMKRKTTFFTTIGAVFAVAIAGRLSVALFGYAIDHGLQAKNREIIKLVAIGYLVLELSRCYLTYLQNFLFTRLGNRALYDIRDQLIRHVESLPISFFEKNPTGRIVTRVTTDVTGLGEVFTQGLINIFSSIITLIAIIAAMSAISIPLTAATVLISPPLIWLVVLINRRLLFALREAKKKIAAINAFVAENVSGMRVTQLYGRIDRNVKRFHLMSRDYRNHQLKTVRHYAMLWPTVSFFNAASVGTALYFGGNFVIEGSLSTGAMVAFILHVRAFIDPLHQILEKYQNLQNSLSGAERVFTLLDQPTENQSSITKNANNLNQERLKGKISFIDTSFRYSDELPLVLKNINLQIDSGQSIALVGRTGSGKSSLITLLQRFYDPTSGSIEIDGKSSTEIDKHHLRSRVGVVQQDTFLFRGTIAQNISLGDPQISRERIEQAAQMACLTDIVKSRPNGLDAKVEERGANLSVGERQLIAFARILAFDPDILILDEATANIDSRTESLIQEATRRVRQGRTSFIIAHRISTILDCDKIVVLESGKIVESGTHSHLMGLNGTYFNLCKAQLKNSQASLEN